MARSRVFPLFSFLLALLLGSFALANKALPNAPEPSPIDSPPRENKPQLAELEVKREGRGETRIVIPMKLLKDADLRLGDAGADRSQRNVIAGLALSAGIVGAFFVLRRTSGKTRVVAAGIFCVVAAGVVSTALADIALPEEFRKPKKPQVVVEFSEEAEAVILVMGADFPDAKRRGGGGRDGAAAPE